MNDWLFNEHRYRSDFERFVEHFGHIRYKEIALAEVLEIPLYFFLNSTVYGRISAKDSAATFAWHRLAALKNAGRIALKKAGAAAPAKIDGIEKAFLFILEGFTPSVTGTILPVAGELPGGTYRIIGSVGITPPDRIEAYLPFETFFQGSLRWKDYFTSVREFHAINRITGFHKPAFLFKAFIELHVMRALQWIDACEAMMNHHPTALVTITETIMLSKIALLSARLKGIPSFVIEHSMTFENLDWSPSHLPVTGDFSLVWGEKDRDWLVKRGARADRVLPLGQPRIDTLMSQGSITREELNAQLDVDRESVIVTLFSQNVTFGFCEKQLLTCYRGIGDYARLSGKKLYLVIKVHPAEYRKFRGFYQEIIMQNRCGNIRLLDDEKKLSNKDLYMNSDLIVTYNSNCGLEALLFRKPLMITNFWPDQVNITDYVSAGGALEARDEKDVCDCLSRVLSEPGFIDEYRARLESYVSYALSSLDGSAGRKIADFICAHSAH
jgi:hypothetical protein